MCFVFHLAQALAWAKFFKWDVEIDFISLVVGELTKKHLANESGSGSNSKMYFDTLNNTALIYDKFSDFDKALQILEKAVDILRHIDDGEAAGAVLCNNLGLICQNKGDFSRAIVEYTRAKICFDKLGYKHPTYVSVLINLGMTNLHLGRYEQALTLLRESSKIEEEVSGTITHTFALIKNNLGNVYFQKGDFGNALLIFKEALQLQRQLYHSGHFDIISTYNNLGLTYKELSKFDLALDQFQLALQLHSNLQMPDNGVIANVYNSLSLLYFDKGDIDSALKYALQVKDMRISVLGDSHVDMISTFNNLGVIYQNNGDLKTAQDYFNKALSLLNRVFGEPHPLYFGIFANIGRNFFLEKDYNTSLIWLDKGWKANTLLPTSDVDVLITLAKTIGAIHYTKGNNDLAYFFANKTYELTVDKYGAESGEAAKLMSILGMVLTSPRKFNEALTFSLRTLILQTKVFGPEHEETKMTKSRIEQLSRHLLG